MLVLIKHYIVHFDLDKNKDVVYAVGLLIYLIGISDKGDIETES